MGLQPALDRVGPGGSTGAWEADTAPAATGDAQAAARPLPPRKQKFLILLLAQLVFFALLWYAAGALSVTLYPLADMLSSRLLLPLLLFFISFFLLAWRSVYSRDYHYYLRRAHGAVLKNAPIPTVLACIGFLLLRSWETEPVPLMGLFLAASFGSFAACDGCQYLWIRHLSHLGYFSRKILVIGRPDPGPATDLHARDFGSTKIYAGEIDRTGSAWIWRPADGGSAKVVKGFPDARTIILKENIGDILLFPDGSADSEFDHEIIDYCQAHSIGYYLVPKGGEPAATGITSLVFPSIPLSERFAGPRDSLTAVSTKRILDFAISFFCLALFLPTGLLVSMAILLLDGPPVFYVSTRVGKNGRPIRFFKFRTMFLDAERQKEKTLAFNARGDGPLFKMKNDPRVTPFGGLLRRYSLDEFPQFLNVLLGTMSLTGPRPHLPEEVARYGEGDYLRLECMPGIVGLPQVSARYTAMGFREWVDLDLEYRREWSIALDMSIMLRTVRLFFHTLFSRRGREHY
jgi:lipopolysaccharide/colanic/teichoic acid biosynthesis glycosyltransferase